MKFNIEYYLDKLEKLDNDPVISRTNQISFKKQLYLAHKTFLEFIFLEAIHQKLDEVNSDYLKIISSLMKERFDYVNSNSHNEILAHKLSIIIIFLKSKILEKTANLSEIEVRKYNLLSDNFTTKIKYILQIENTFFFGDIKTYFIPILIDPTNSIFLQFFLDNIAHNTTFPDSRITYINNDISKMKLLTTQEKSLFFSFFSPERQSEKMIGDLTKLPYIDRLLKFQLILSNLNKFPEKFFESKINQKIIYDTLLVRHQVSYSNEHSELIFFILNYDSLRFLLKNTRKICNINLQDVEGHFCRMLSSNIEELYTYAHKYCVIIRCFNIDKSFIKFFQLMINYGLHFDEKIIMHMDRHKNLFNLVYPVYRYYIESLMDNWKLALNKSMNQNYIPTILKDDPRIIKNILLHKEFIRYYLINRNISPVMQNISFPQETDLSSLDKIVFLAERFFFEIFAIKKYNKAGIFGDKYIMHQISFYLTDFETFRELVVKSYLNEAEIIEEIEKNIPIIKNNLRGAIEANDEKEVKYILSNMDAKHFDEIKLEELIYVRNTDIIDKKYLDILKNHINAPNSIIKLDDRNSEKIKEGSSEISSQTDTTSLTINSKRTSEQANKIEDSNKLPTSSNSNIMLPPQKKQR